MLTQQKLKILPWIVGLGLFIENIDITVINTSLPQIANSLGADPLNLKIGITSYLLTLALFIPISGYIADRIGTQKTFSLAILIFMAGSLICEFAQNLSTLIIGRLSEPLTPLKRVCFRLLCSSVFHFCTSVLLSAPPTLTFRSSCGRPMVR